MSATISLHYDDGMLKPISKSGVLGIGANSMFTHDHSAEGTEALEAARNLHELLTDDVNMRACERSALARLISGHLFSVESGRILPDASRKFFVRLRTDAFQRAASADFIPLPEVVSIWAGYDAIEGALSSRQSRHMNSPPAAFSPR
jgi:hypothetical protein